MTIVSNCIIVVCRWANDTSRTSQMEPITFCFTVVTRIRLNRMRKVFVLIQMFSLFLWWMLSIGLSEEYIFSSSRHRSSMQTRMGNFWFFLLQRAFWYFFSIRQSKVGKKRKNNSISRFMGQSAKVPYRSLLIVTKMWYKMSFDECKTLSSTYFPCWLFPCVFFSGWYIMWQICV